MNNIQIRKILGPIFHMAAVLHHVYALIYPIKEIDVFKIEDEKVLHTIKFSPVFFTTWNTLLQTLYFSLALYHDYLERFGKDEKLKKKIEYYKGYIFNTYLFPFSIFIVTLFWGVYNFNRELVFSEILDDYIPQWVNHLFHTNVLFIVIIEVLIANQLMPTFKSAFIGLTLFSGIYHAAFIFAHFISGKWAYALFYVISWPERILFMIFNYLFTVAMMKLGMFIQDFKHNLFRKNQSESAKLK